MGENPQAPQVGLEPTTLRLTVEAVPEEYPKPSSGEAPTRASGTPRIAPGSPSSSPSGPRRHAPAGYLTLDEVDARELAPGTELFTPHTSAGRDADGRWKLAAVRVEQVRPVGEIDGVEVSVIDVSIPRGEGRITLAYAPGDLLCRKPARGEIAR
jgi:hypothetical protein